MTTPLGLVLPLRSATGVAATDVATLQGALDAASPGDTVLMSGLYVIDRPLYYPPGIVVAGNGRNIAEGMTVPAAASGLKLAAGSDANFVPAMPSNIATAAVNNVSNASVRITFTSPANVAVGMTVVDSLGLLPAGTTVTRVISTTQIQIDRLPTGSNPLSADMLGFCYGLAMLTPVGYRDNASSFDLPCEFRDLYFDGQNDGLLGIGAGNQAGHCLILPPGRTRVTNCSFNNSPGHGVVIADVNLSGSGWTGAPAEPRIENNTFRNCGQISFLNANTPGVANATNATDGYFVNTVVQSPGGQGFPSKYKQSSGTSSNGMGTVSGLTVQPVVGSRICGPGLSDGVDATGCYIKTVSGSGPWSVTLRNIKAGSTELANSDAGAGEFAYGFGDSWFPGVLFAATGGWFILYNHVYDAPGDGFVVSNDTSATIIGNEVDNFGTGGRAGAVYTGINIAAQAAADGTSTSNVPLTFHANDVKQKSPYPGSTTAPPCGVGGTKTTYQWFSVTVIATGTPPPSNTISWVGNRSHLSATAISGATYVQYNWTVPATARLTVDMAGGNAEDPNITTFQTGTGVTNKTVIVQRPFKIRYITTAAAYTAVDGDYVTVTAAVTITCPPNYPGARFKVVNLTVAGTVTVQPPSGSINGGANLPFLGQYTARDVVGDGTNWFAT